MSKDKLKWIIYFLIFTVLCLIVVFARSIFDALNLSETLMIVFGSIMLNAFILVSGYAIFRKLRMVAFWKLAVYLVFISAASSCIEIFLHMSQLPISPFFTSNDYLFFILGGFLILVFFNYTLLRIIFAVNARESCLIGIIISLINTIFLLPSYK